MTNRTSDEIRADIAANSRALVQANDDAALYERLKKAPAEANRLRKDGDTLRAELLSTADAEYQQRMNTYYRNPRVSVIPGYGEHASPGIMGNKYVITYEAPQWDGHVTRWLDKSVDGFDLLDSPLLNHIVDYRPELIPQEILALSDAGPRAAMTRYLDAKSNGVLEL